MIGGRVLPLGAVAAAAAALAGCSSGGNAFQGAAGETVPVTRVVDGDTIVVELRGEQERVRYIGVDAPESVKPDSPVECYGPQASEANTRLVEGGEVRLEFDVEDRDDYGRLLAWVFGPDGKLVNERLIADGYAERFRNTPNQRYKDELVQAEKAAQREDLGLWGSCPR